MACKRKGALNDMIDKIEFTAKNLTSNVRVLPFLAVKNKKAKFH